MAEPEAGIETIAAELHRAVVDATPRWIRHSVLAVTRAQQIPIPDDRRGLVEEAAARGEQFVDRHLRELLETDIDRQTTTPLSILRDAARFPVEVLHDLGAQEVHRIDVERWAFPNDPFGVTPVSLAELGTEVQQAGIAWGAAKAYLHLQRRGNEARP